MTTKPLFVSAILLLAVTCACGVEIECVFRDAAFGVHAENKYACNGAITNAENPGTVTNITGDHLQGRNHSDVRGFLMRGDIHLSMIPGGIENFLPNINAISWTNGSLSSIDSFTFKAFPNMDIITLNENKIVSLESGLFFYTRRIRQFGLSFNLLENVAHNLMTSATYLYSVGMYQNPCISVFASNIIEVQALGTRLPITCPPLPQTCPVRCPINEQVENMMEMILELQNQMSTCQCQANQTTQN